MISTADLSQHYQQGPPGGETTQGEAGLKAQEAGTERPLAFRWKSQTRFVSELNENTENDREHL